MVHRATWQLAVKSGSHVTHSVSSTRLRAQVAELKKVSMGGGPGVANFL